MLLLLHRSCYDYRKMGGHFRANKSNGFTLIELTVIISVIGILAVLTTAVIIPGSKEKTRHTKAMSEMSTISDAVHLYTAKYNEYPADSPNAVPEVLNEFIKNDGVDPNWPNAPWAGSTYSVNNWPADDNGNQETHQITIKFCNVGDEATCKKNFPKQPWVKEDWDSYSTVYMCISGSCRSDQNKPVSHPGLCMNCGSSMKQMGN